MDKTNEDVTAETVTDEQIRALRNDVAPMDRPRPRAERSTEDLDMIDICDRAMTPYPEYAAKRAHARQRIAAAINARAKGGR